MDQVQAVPLFMRETPTAEQVANNPNLAALAAILTDDGETIEVAEYYKKEGNDAFKAGNKLVVGGAKGTKKSVGGKALDDGMVMTEKMKHYRNAVEKYTMGIGTIMKEAKTSEEMGLLVTLYMNRSMCNLSLGNYRMCINDCEDAEAALEIKNSLPVAREEGEVDNKENMGAKIEEVTNEDTKGEKTATQLPVVVDFRPKIHFRAAKAYLALRQYTTALTWVDKGLSGEPANDAMLKLRKEIMTEKGKYERMYRKQEKENKRVAKELRELVAAVNIRGIKLCSADTTAEDKNSDRALHTSEWFENSSTGKCTLIKAAQEGEEDHLAWPVYFMYPESNQSDFIQSFHETTSLMDHAKAILAEAAPWDPSHNYNPTNVEFYYGTTDPKTDKAWLVQVNKENPLLYVLQTPRLAIPGGLLQFIVLPKTGAFRTEYIKNFEGVVQE
ncbi:hypothetical protein SARC_05254 [Sphaeroforma arctica JP610]|uniref:Cns1/TTC4 wheel domain-containing protein n=1 Tax=Sphaeroforma arctica JP610 TaxID=667725 RepID=A0A0L0G022_9EUKA|nr:hypothetical protein SARC_05254 [Sphaeroforma arctica JP610]KNC82462.1 hypothetical protein SARC_05254 [Sphaeroforma arctica JP610]|eukprot:XP_014156364.1 hypothetical protein SARC_05254 [Sphaeroforma arctica JP610]